MVRVVKGDITKLDCDAIVNAANESLLGGGGVDGAIHAAAGPELLEACRAIGGCKTGQAVITPGFALPADHVIHTVGPVWRGGLFEEPRLLTNAYENSFSLAQANGVKTIAFPCISTGIYGYPLEDACRIAVWVMQNFNEEFDQIIACCFNDETFTRYQELIG
ncbi:MAG: O-acetyl-ADP-ribose deacetylase [Pseudomonadota bacterium]